MDCPATTGKPSKYLSAHVLQLRCETIHYTLLQNMLVRIYDRVHFPDQFIPFPCKRQIHHVTSLLPSAPYPPPATVEFDSSADAPPSSNATIFSQDEPTPTRSSPNTTTFMSTTLATQLSPTEAPIDRNRNAILALVPKRQHLQTLPSATP
jgi:hypothetical protein